MHYEIDDFCSNILYNIDKKEIKLSEKDRDLIIKDVDEIPNGWLTSFEACKKLGVSVSQGTKWLAIMRKSGVIEMKKFKIRTSGRTGVVRLTEHYRLVK